MGRKRTAVQQLIAAYRNVGARWADLDPLKRTERDNIPELEPSFYGFSDADQETVFNTSNTFFGKDTDVAARAAQCAARNLLRHHRRRVHVQHRPGAKALVAAKAGKHPQQAHSTPRRKSTSWTA
jgi:2-oxoglutarate dehydrogenase complex dehydrogenase (E1) component-like enzyme